MTQAQVLGQGVLLGLGLGVLYDWMRSIRRCCAWRWLWFTLDVIFWVGTAATVFAHALLLGNGVVRIYHGLAIFLGGVVYLTTASRVLLPIFVKCFSILRHVLALTFTPARIAVGETKKVWKNSKKDFQKWVKWYRISVVYGVDAHVEKEAGQSESQTRRHWHKTFGRCAPGSRRHRPAVHKRAAGSGAGEKR